MNRAHSDEKVNFWLRCEYDDFLEFLENELGVDNLKELQEKFHAQEEASSNKWYEKWSGKSDITQP